MNDQIRSLFPALQHWTYLNSAAVSPIPKTAVSAVLSQLQDVSLNGSEHYTDWIATKTRSRTLLAEMMHVRPEDVAFMRNTSDGFAAVANGIGWKPGDNIVSFEREFPANFYPWRMVRDRFGVELRLCPERNGGIDLDEFVDLVDGNTRLVTISAVQYGSGFRADLQQIGRIVRERDALFAVDVIQGLGQFSLDLPGDFVDIASGASHKWLCAPEGCGFVYLSERARSMVDPSFVGWISVETPWDFEDREQHFKPNALALESGTGPSALFYGLEQSLKLLTSVGLDVIEKHVLDLSERLCEAAVEKGYEIVGSRKPFERSAIVCMKHNGGVHASEIAESLQREGVMVSARGERLRIAPHFYNNIHDIERLIDTLP